MHRMHMHMHRMHMHMHTQVHTHMHMHMHTHKGPTSSTTHRAPCAPCVPITALHHSPLPLRPLHHSPHHCPCALSITHHTIAPVRSWRTATSSLPNGSW